MSNLFIEISGIDCLRLDIVRLDSLSYPHPYPLPPTNPQIRAIIKAGGERNDTKSHIVKDLLSGVNHQSGCNPSPSISEGTVSNTTPSKGFIPLACQNSREIRFSQSSRSPV